MTPISATIPLAVRELVVGDAPALEEIHGAAFARPWTATEFAGLLSGGACFGCRAEIGAGAVAGFVLARAAADEAEILTLAVVPGMRRRGIAHALLAAVLDAAARRGARRMFLEVAADNPPARSLYARHGFAQVGRRPAYYRSSGGRLDALVLARPLDERVDVIPGDSYNRG